METSIRILHLEDDPADAELVEATMVESGLATRISHARTQAEFETGLGDGGTDIILADYKLPGYDGLSALHLAQERCPEIPFIFVSGTMGEAAAIEALTQGATDYVLKQNLARLPSAVQRALHEARNWLERRRAEAALRASEARYIDLYDNAPDMYLSADAQTAAITNCNQTLADTLGYPKGEIIGRSIYAIYHPDCLDRAKQTRAEFLECGEIHDRELQLRKKDGTKLDVSLNVSAVRTRSGTIAYSRATLRDITERKKLEAQLVQAQKMEAVGQLAGGVAHDFNNMLGVIIGYAEMLLEQETLDDSLRGHLEQILGAGHRSTEITRQLLAFARKQTIAPKILDLNKTVEGMLKLLRRLIGEDIDLAWLPGTKLGPVKMDPSQIDQILANLCVNARDAIDGVGKVTIETFKVNFDDAYCAEHEGFSPGEYVMLAVSDNGSGMDKATADKIFEPFFTTKTMGKGTGLGLATVYGIVKQNEGFIQVYSEPGHGSTFKIYLPRHTVMTGPEPKANPEPSALMGHETILVVEDENLHLQLVVLMLERYGYQVLDASSPGEALLAAKNHTGHIHLLLTDLVLPEMNGRDLAKEITALYPEVACLFMSGYSGDIVAEHGVLEEGIHFIQKPFSKRVLAEKVREVLDGK